MIDLYKILDISKNAVLKEIKDAYRKKSKLLHPDTGGNKEDFDLICKAYKILSDEGKRKRYDSGENIDNILNANNDKSLSIIGTIFIQLLQNYNPDGENIIVLLRNSINENINNINNKINEFERLIKKHEKFQKRLKVKNKKENFLYKMSCSEIQTKTEILENINKEKNDFKIALDKISSFDYDNSY